MTIEALSSQNETPKARKQVKTSTAPDKRIEIFPGMTIDNIEKIGSKGQQVTACAFHQGGIYSAFTPEEAENMNNYRFTLDEANKELRVHNIVTDGHVTIKYNNDKPLGDWPYVGLVRVAEKLKGNVVFDLRNGTGNRTATYSDVTADCIDTFYCTNSRIYNISIRNSNIKKIDVDTDRDMNFELKLENVSNIGLLWDSPTEVNLDNAMNLEKIHITPLRNCKLSITGAERKDTPFVYSGIYGSVK